MQIRRRLPHFNNNASTRIQGDKKRKKGVVDAILEHKTSNLPGLSQSVVSHDWDFVLNMINFVLYQSKPRVFIFFCVFF